MKFFPVLLAFLASVVFANPLIEKRASVSDVATIGYATQTGGTSGGGTATPITVTTLAALTSALASSATSRVIIISGTITGNEVLKVPSNTTVVGKSGATLTGVGLRVLSVSNVIIRNLKINKVLAEAGDAIGIQAAHNVWVDHVELWSDMDHDKDYYDGLLDITHGSYSISVTWTYFHDHWKASLVGHSDSNEAEDTAITVTYAYDKWYNLNSRTPSVRFGHVHIFCNYYLDVNDGINTRVGAELLVQNSVFENVDQPLYSTDSGYANASGNDFGGGSNTALPTSWSAVPYSYTLPSLTTCKGNDATIGATLAF